jgi:hypothetical protein
MFHSPKTSWGVLTRAAEQEACWISVGGTFEQLEDSRARGLRVCRHRWKRPSMGMRRGPAPRVTPNRARRSRRLARVQQPSETGAVIAHTGRCRKGQGKSRDRLRHGAVPAGDPAEARDCAAYRDRRGDRLLQGVRVRHSAWETDAACFDVGRAGEPGRRRVHRAARLAAPVATRLSERCNTQSHDPRRLAVALRPLHTVSLEALEPLELLRFASPP